MTTSDRQDPVLGRRKQRKNRCQGCGLAPDLCACDVLVAVDVQTPIVIVQHVRERHKPTNTARLVAQMVPSITLIHYGMRDPPFDPGPLEDPSITWYALFPRDDAQPLPPGGFPETPPRRSGFVVLDGTWHQCSRMARRVPKVRELPCVALPPGAPSIWRARKQHDPQGLSTFEATARLIEQIEGKATTELLWHAFVQINTRTMIMRGTPEAPRAEGSGDEPLR